MFNPNNLKYRDRPASNKKPLSDYTYGDLLDMRSQGLTNSEIARKIGLSSNTSISNKIGPQPPKNAIIQLRAQYLAKLKELAKPEKQQLYHNRVSYHENGVHITADLDNHTIRISPTAANWITINFDQLDAVITGLRQVLTTVKLNKEKNENPSK